MKYKYLVLVTLSLVIMLVTNCTNAKDFTKRTYSNLGVGMTIDDVIEAVGREGTVITMNVDKTRVVNHLTAKYSEFDEDAELWEYMIITYTSALYKSSLAVRYKVFVASVIFERGVIIHLISKETEVR